LQKLLLFLAAVVAEKNASSAALEVCRHGSVFLNCLFGAAKQTKIKCPGVSFCCFLSEVIAIFL